MIKPASLLSFIFTTLLSLNHVVLASESESLRFLEKSYQGEDSRGVVYLESYEELSPYRAVFHKGAVYFKNESTGFLEKFRPPVSMHGSYIYVVAPDGTFYISYHNELDKFHHSSLAAGGPVICAGELSIDYRRGKITYMNNASGHYKPGPEHLTQAIRLLRDYGMETRGMVLGITNGSGYKEITLKS